VGHSFFEVERVSATLGGRVHGLDLRRRLPDEVFAELQQALLEHQVLFFHDQPLDEGQHIALARRFGELTVYPVIKVLGGDQVLETIEDNADSPPKAEFWHTDIPWLAVPPKIGILNARHMPPVGGDTMWASLTAAYQRLSDPMKTSVESLVGHHDVDAFFFSQVEKALGPELVAKVRGKIEGGADHPLVTRHPETGARILYFSGVFFQSIVGLSEKESRMWIDFLWDHVDHPDLAVRWRWQVNDLAIWDERCTIHRALTDHYPERRIVRRCTVDAEVRPSA
jgi:taurine dioxygenase